MLRLNQIYFYLSEIVWKLTHTLKRGHSLSKWHFSDNLCDILILKIAFFMLISFDR